MYARDSGCNSNKVYIEKPFFIRYVKLVDLLVRPSLPIPQRNFQSKEMMFKSKCRRNRPSTCFLSSISSHAYRDGLFAFTWEWRNFSVMDQTTNKSIVCLQYCFNDLRQIHDDVIKWKHLPLLLASCVVNSLGIHRSPENSPHKGRWRGALMFSLVCAWINSWVNNREAGDLRRYRPHYGVTLMFASGNGLLPDGTKPILD